MKVKTRYANEFTAAAVRAEEALLEEAVQLAAEPLSIDEEPPEERVEAPPLEPDTSDVQQGEISDPETLTLDRADVLLAALEAVAQSQSHKDRQWERRLEQTLALVGESLKRPQPQHPDIHVHTPRHDLSVHVDQPDFKPEITVEAAKIELPDPAPVQVDVHVPEAPAPQVTVAAATPEVVVQAGPAPVVNVTVPDELRVIPAETETIAERDDDDLLVRSVTRPTGASR